MTKVIESEGGSDGYGQAGSDSGDRILAFSKSYWVMNDGEVLDS
jgi:hypothetical protein